MIFDGLNEFDVLLFGLKSGNEIVVVGLVDVQHQGSGIQVNAVLGLGDLERRKKQGFGGIEKLE
jgi:hypothetical protein